MVIVGLLGGEGAGKTTAAKYLEEKYSAKRYTLAAPLKELVRLAFDLLPEQVYGTQEQKNAIDPRYNVSPRWLLRRIGTQGVREVFGADFWVEQTLSFIREDAPIVAVIDDVRFINESESLKNFHGKVIKLVNENAPRVTGHQSEEEWDKAPHDYYIKHDGKTLKYLENQLDVIMESISKPTAPSWKPQITAWTAWLKESEK